ncbi:MAG TPA: hypothetical protein DIU15_00460, partial [Deltaproteobacteria bacterium]|nr:hypothetical protein [Deltaproteobacteria bacterium]
MRDVRFSVPLLFVLLVLVAALPLLASACGQQRSTESPFGSTSGSGGSSDDDDDTTTNDGEDLSSGWIEVSRVANLGAASAVIRAVAAWYPAQVVMAQPSIADDLDDCITGSGDAALYGLPESELDVGLTVLSMASGDEVLELAGDHHSANLPYTSWEANQEYNIQTTGGDDVDPLELEGALGTPSSIALNTVDSGEAGYTIEWLGGDNSNEIPLLVTIEDGGVLHWIGCRVLDDGEFLLPLTHTASLPAGLASLELRRQVVTNFEIPGHADGTVVGVARALTAIEIIETGDDDDSADD